MATELLNIPEEHLEEVIKIIEAGMKARKKVSKDVRDGLTRWCKSEKEYLKRLNEED